MSEYFKVNNNEDVPIKVDITDLIGSEDVSSSFVLLAHGSAVVSRGVAYQLQRHYSGLEVSDATLEDYKGYRLEKEKVLEEAKALEVERLKAEALKVKEEEKVIKAEAVEAKELEKELKTKVEHKKGRSKKLKN